MLVLKRKEGQWTEIKHVESGDVIRIRVYRIREGFPSQCDLAFDDNAHNFDVERPERKSGPRITEIDPRGDGPRAA